uniref:PDZ domain-containing protein n=1 Tax=Romanomermis culicivorax TaxID=13658 RepID=A0A915K939_ROMCU
MSTGKWTDAKSLYSSKPYGTVYSTYELPGTRIYRDNETHHGLVTLSDGSRPGKPARLELTTDALTIQIPLSLASWYEENKETVLGENARIVTLQRLPDSGFGFSIKGGFSGTCRAPIIISKVWRDQENVERVKQLLVGDAIIELNGIPVENKTHDEVVQLLRESSEKLELKVKHQKDVACYLKKMPFGKSQTSMISDLSTAASTLSFQSPTIYSPTEAPKGWKSVARIPLPMAYITRYLRGTDKIRPNAFEVRAVDGSSSGLIYCEDQKIVDQWMQYIMKNIIRLNSKSIKMSNKFLHPDELIVYLGWVCEKIDDVNNNGTIESKEFWQSWEPRFLILKGSEICLFEAPPLNTEDLGKCLISYRIIDTRFKDVKVITIDALNENDFRWVVTPDEYATEWESAILRNESAIGRTADCHRFIRFNRRQSPIHEISSINVMLFYLVRGIGTFEIKIGDSSRLSLIAGDKDSRTFSLLNG